MKVLHLSTTIHGGSGIAANALHSSLYKKNINSFIQTKNNQKLKFREQPFLFLKSKFVTKVVTILQAKVIQKNDELISLISLSTFNRRILLNGHFDVVHIHATYNFISLKDLKWLAKKKVPVVITFHDIRMITGACHAEINCSKFETKCNDCPKMRFPFSKLVRLSQERLAKVLIDLNPVVIVPSNWLRRKIEKSFLYKNLNVVVIPNIIRTPKKPRENLLNSDLDHLLIGKSRIGFIAQDLNSPYKGFKVLFGALQLLSERDRNNLIVVLVGQDQQNAVSQLLELGLEVEHHRQTDDVIDILKTLDYCIVPSVADNYPNVALEALFAGVQIITSDAGGLKEISGLSGSLTFRSGNSKELSTIFRQILLNPIKKPKVLFDMAEFNERNIDSYAQIYEEVIRKKSS